MALTPVQVEHLLDTCVAVVEATQRARYLVNAAESGVVPTEHTPNTRDMLATQRLLAKYAADRTLWSRLPEGNSMISELRALTLHQVALYAPVHDRADALLTLTDWFEIELPSLGRTRAVLAAEGVGSVLGYPAPSSRSGKRVLDRDDRRCKRREPTERVTIAAAVQ